MTGTAAGLNISIPSALMGFYRPLWSVSQRRTSLHFQRRRVRIMRTIRHQMNCRRWLKVCFATACLK
jgi:hypothetical protein